MRPNKHLTLISRLESNDRYRKTKNGFLRHCYAAMKHRHPVEFSSQEFHDRYIEDPKFNRLFDYWERHDYKPSLVPSPDRIDCLKDYTFDNINWLTWADNRFKLRFDLVRSQARPILMVKYGKVIKKFNGLKSASRSTALPNSNICACLHGRLKTCGGYEWYFEEDF